MCIKSYQANLPGELLLSKGDIVESRFRVLYSFLLFQMINLVLSVGEQGYLEGRCKDLEGWFPSNHVQDICVFSKL